jgi:hypothetical protein
VRHFVVVALVIMLFLSITTLSVSASSVSGHGCAPRVPPAVPGTPAPAISGTVVINEVLLMPYSTWNCSESPGTYSLITDTWIELYNTRNQPLDLYASHSVIDSGPGTNSFYFPFTASIAAHGYLVLFPRYDASFLSTETSTLRLLIGGAVLDQVTIPHLTADQSYARTADGAASWHVSSTPTIDSSNSTRPATPPAATSPPGGQNGPGGNSGRGHSNRGTSTWNNANNPKALVNGVQPQWSILQLPAVTTTFASNTAPSAVAPSTSTPSSSNFVDIVRRPALTVLFILLALVILWCWRAFYKKNP